MFPSEWSDGPRHHTAHVFTVTEGEGGDMWPAGVDVECFGTEGGADGDLVAGGGRRVEEKMPPKLVKAR